MTSTPSIQPASEGFQTHLVYIKKLALLSQGLGFTFNIASVVTTLSPVQAKKIDAKMKLIEMTKQSVDQELAIVRAYADYSSASVTWLPIKVYYLNYHLLCLIEFFLTGNDADLSVSHKDCLKRFSRRLKDNEASFSEALFNQTFGKDIFAFTVSSGTNLTMRSPNDIIYKLIMKKTAKENIEEYMRSQGITSKRSNENKAKIARQQDRLVVSIFSFFYFMRIRLNYKNFSFMEQMPPASTAEYFEAYYETANNFYSCFSATIQTLRSGVR